MDRAAEVAPVEETARIAIINAPLARGRQAKLDPVEVQEINGMVQFYHVGDVERMKGQVRATRRRGTRSARRSEGFLVVERTLLKGNDALCNAIPGSVRHISSFAPGS
jgi:hypothetical protein